MEGTVLANEDLDAPVHEAWTGLQVADLRWSSSALGAHRQDTEKVQRCMCQLEKCTGWDEGRDSLR